MSILTAAVEYVGIDSSDDVSMTYSIDFNEMVNKRILKEVNMTDDGLDQSVLRKSRFVL